MVLNLAVWLIFDGKLYLYLCVYVCICVFMFMHRCVCSCIGVHVSAEYLENPKLFSHGTIVSSHLAEKDIHQSSDGNYEFGSSGETVPLSTAKTVCKNSVTNYYEL